MHHYSIDHKILLQRLEQHVGIKRTALGWFQSYLSDIFKFVNINNDSSMNTHRHGVPKGSVKNFLLLNSEITEVILIGPKHLRETR